MWDSFFSKFYSIYYRPHLKDPRIYCFQFLCLFIWGSCIEGPLPPYAPPPKKNPLWAILNKFGHVLLGPAPKIHNGYWPARCWLHRGRNTSSGNAGRLPSCYMKWMVTWSPPPGGWLLSRDVVLSSWQNMCGYPSSFRISFSMRFGTEDWIDRASFNYFDQLLRIKTAFFGNETIIDYRGHQHWYLLEQNRGSVRSTDLENRVAAKSVVRRDKFRTEILTLGPSPDFTAPLPLHPLSELLNGELRLGSDSVWRPSPLCSGSFRLVIWCEASDVLWPYHMCTPRSDRELCLVCTDHQSFLVALPTHIVSFHDKPASRYGSHSLPHIHLRKTKICFC